MWFFSDTGMVWYVWDMCYAIMRCILKWFYHVSNQLAENRSWPITGYFTLLMLGKFMQKNIFKKLTWKHIIQLVWTESGANLKKLYF